MILTFYKCSCEYTYISSIATNIEQIALQYITWYIQHAAHYKQKSQMVTFLIADHADVSVVNMVCLEYKHSISNSCKILVISVAEFLAGTVLLTCKHTPMI